MSGVERSTFASLPASAIFPVLMQLVINLLLGIYVVVALLMLLVILMQRPRSEGLGAAFGGGVTENIFGAQTTNVLVKATAWLAAIFFSLTFTLSVLYAHKTSGDSGLRRELLKQQTGGATASPAPGASVSPAAPAASASVSPEAAASQNAAPKTSAAPSASAPAAPVGTASPAKPAPR
jgi:preprotein translocase subunit SecG